MTTLYALKIKVDGHWSLFIPPNRRSPFGSKDSWTNSRSALIEDFGKANWLGATEAKIITREIHPTDDPHRHIDTLRRFALVRDVDVTGTSGTGVVALGVVLPDGHAAMRWVVGEYQSTVTWESVEAIDTVHGHEGRTRLVWEET